MKESELKEFLDGELDALRLASMLDDAEDDAELDADLEDEVVLTCADLVKLCDAHLHGVLTLDALQGLAASVLCSDNFTWDEQSEDGELVAAVLWDWSATDEDETLTSAKVTEHRRALGEAVPQD